MNHKNNKRSETTKSKIKAALIEMLTLQELDKITVRALCEKASINRSTFYNHYNSPGAILKSIQEDFAGTLAFHLQSAREMCSQASKTDVLKILYTNILEFIKDNLEICHVLSDTTLCPDFAGILAEDPIIVESFQNSLANSSYKEEDKEYVRRFLFYGSFHAMDLWMKKDCDRSPSEIAELITGIISKF